LGQNGVCHESEIGVVLRRGCNGVVCGPLHPPQGLQGCTPIFFQTGTRKYPHQFLSLFNFYYFGVLIFFRLIYVAFSFCSPNHVIA